VAFLAFLGLFVYANGQRPQRFWADLFARFDPLLMLSASLSGRTLLGGLLLAGIVLVLSLLFGRVWCGWLCPLGSLLQWLGPRRPRSARPAEGLRAAKHVMLVAILSLALFGYQTLVFLDPITILNRTLAVSAWPALRGLVTGVERFLYRFPILWGPLDEFHAYIVQSVFQEGTPVYRLAIPSAMLFVTIVALNWWAVRFWCRYLCPLGSLLGVLSKVSLVRRVVEDGCSHCGRCQPSCPTGTIDPNEGYRSDPAECIVCYDCVTECTQDGVGFGWHLKGWRPSAARDYEPGRRQVLAAVGASAVGAMLAGVEPVTLRQPATMIRPPGTALTEFAALCIRCGACVRACPTHGLQPTLFEGGIQNLLTPRLIPRLGYCSYGCKACGEVCPTGAVPLLELEAKQQTVIGLAAIDQGRCLPWAYATRCIVCEEACPVPDKAIALEEVETVDDSGNILTVQRPKVIRELCIGCGTCEYQCPVGGEAAIRIHAPLLLDAV
jgi:polyferredoxin